jgi:CheY-like chemotaxis protein
MFVMSAEELTVGQSAAEQTRDQSAAPQYIATVVIAPPLKPPASSAAAAVESATGSAGATAVGTSTATGAPPTSGATEIAVIIEPEMLNTPTSGSGTTAGITAATRGSTTDIRVARESARSHPASSAQSRFLVVDDSLPVRIQMKEALQKFAKTIDFAHDAEQAMILIDNCKYDVIFLDVILPGKDGYDVCRYIRTHKMQRQTPVIMLTGNSAPADRVKGKLAGCDTYLIKPVRQGVLAEVIGEFIKSSAVA